ncbi:MAG: hypothetical protein H6555_09780 [Lewinellaceae bacterium]|nr:hypothetical protein [Lewinellaceae bacterium]
MRYLTAILAFGLLTLVACSSNRYYTADYNRFASRHHLLAVIPVAVNTSGRLDKKLTAEDIAHLENAESRAFQIGFYYELAERSGSRIAVSFQPVEETNRRLEAAGIDPKQATQLSAVELAELLEVDAIVQTHIDKAFYLTDLESFGIDLARFIVGTFSSGPGWFFMPNAKTSDVFTRVSILDGESGAAVWTMQRRGATQWNRPSREVIGQLTRVFARRFPYR